LRSTPARELLRGSAHSRVGFSVRHLGLSSVEGHFTNATVEIQVEAAATDSLRVKAIIQVKSINTGVAARDKHLLSADYFDAENFPEIRFEADGDLGTGETRSVEGTLTMRGVSKPVTLPVTVSGPITDPWGNQRIGFQIITKLSRKDYGVGADKATDKLVGDEVSVRIDGEATLKTAK